MGWLKPAYLLTFVVTNLVQSLQLPQNHFLTITLKSLYWEMRVSLSKKLDYHSQISSSSIIGSNTSISKLGVIIEDDVFIDDSVVIKPGVTIKRGAKIGPGCVLGSTGLEVKDTIFGGH